MENSAERRYVVKNINIQRGWGDTPEYSAMMSIENAYGNEIKIKIPEERILAFIDLTADLVKLSLQEQLGNMREDVQHMLEQRAAAALPSPIEADLSESE